VRALPAGIALRTSIAIVGAGPAGLAVARAVLRRVPRADLALFDPALSDPLLKGRGTPYRPDPAEPLLNAPLRYMSVDPDDADHCARWFVSGSRTRGDVSYGTLSRPAYGRYLQSFLDDLPGNASSDQRVSLRPVEVIALRAVGRQHELLSSRCELGRFDAVILCTGWSTVTPATAASGTVHETVRHHLGRTDVVIRGTGLSAVDHARALLSSAPEARIAMTSRHGLLPGVRPSSAPSDDFFLSVSSSGHHDLTTVGGLVSRLELEAGQRGIDLGPLGEALRSTPDPARWLEDGLNEIEGVSWRDLAVAASEALLPRAWRTWNSTHRQVFLRRFHTYAQSWCNPMPPSTAQLLLEALRTGRLTVRSGATRSRGHLLPTIDATRSGTDSLAPLDVPLIRCLVNAGLAAPDPFGGILTTRRHHVTGNSHGASLFAVGALTQGTHYVVNALDAVVQQAAEVADEIAGLGH